MLDIVLGSKAKEGKCYNHPDPDWFHIPGSGDNLKYQKKFCEDCKIIKECLSYAVKHDVSGVWGGTTTRERQMMRSKMGLRVIPISLREARYD
jgi:hypothetical protein